MTDILSEQELLTQYRYLKADGFKKVILHMKAREIELEKLHEVLKALASENAELKKRPETYDRT